MPVSLRSVDARIPADLNTIIVKAIEKDPADRYATAGEMAADLRNFLEHRPITARPPSRVTRLRKWARRRPRVVAAAFAVMLLITVVSAVSAAPVTAANYRAQTEKQDAEQNLRIAAETIDKLLARYAEDAQTHGQLRHADDLLRDAVASYDELLAKSDDPPLVLKSASAHHQLSEVLRLGAEYDEAHRVAEKGHQLFRQLSDEMFDTDEARTLRAYPVGGQRYGQGQCPRLRVSRVVVSRMPRGARAALRRQTG